MDTNWKVKIIDKGYTTIYDIFIYCKGFGNKINLVQKGGEILESFEDGVVQDPSVRLDREQLQAFANALNEMGINPQKEYVQGKLEATENHLKDMRKLLKLSDNK